jgi:TolB protein
VECKLKYVSCWLLFACGSITFAEEQLTVDGRLKRDATFVDGGKSIVFGVDESDTLVRLMRLNLKTKKQEPLHPESPKTEYEPSFSADGRFESFTLCKANLAMELIIRDTKTGKQVVIGHKGRGGYTGSQISPDATQVVYCFAENGPQHIWSVNIEGKEKKQLTDGAGINNWPSFSPDGKHILFASSRTGTYEIYLMKSDGSDVKQITNNNKMEIRPRLSPDGKRIAYVTNDGGDRDIFVMDINGKNQRRVTSNPARDDYPFWHPDGKRLVYASERQGKFDLFLIDVPAEAPK